MSGKLTWEDAAVVSQIPDPKVRIERGFVIYFQKLLRDILNLFGVAIFIMHIAFQNRKESLKESIQMRFKLVVGFFTIVNFLCGLYSICKATL